MLYEILFWSLWLLPVLAFVVVPELREHLAVDGLQGFALVAGWPVALIIILVAAGTESALEWWDGRQQGRGA